MKYDHSLNLSLPATLLPIAAAIARALDPDTGGADSWTVDGDNIVMSTVCTEQFYTQARALMADPATLHYVVGQDYANRWQDLTPPTLAECEAFCAALVVIEPISYEPVRDV